jgi:hypothetical protein
VCVRVCAWCCPPPPLLKRVVPTTGHLPTRVTPLPLTLRPSTRTYPYPIPALLAPCMPPSCGAPRPHRWRATRSGGPRGSHVHRGWHPLHPCGHASVHPAVHGRHPRRHAPCAAACCVRAHAIRARASPLLVARVCRVWCAGVGGASNSVGPRWTRVIAPCLLPPPPPPPSSSSSPYSSSCLLCHCVYSVSPASWLLA